MRESIAHFFEHSLIWAGLGLLLLICLVTCGLLVSQRYRDRITRRFAMQVGLQIGSDATFAAVQRRAVATAVGGAIGSALAVVIAAVMLFANPQMNSVNFLWVVVIPLIVSVSSLGQVAVALRETLFRQRADAPRVARPRATGSEDYVSPRRRGLAPALLVLAISVNVTGVILALSGVIDARGYFGSAALPLLVAAVITFGAGLLADRLVLGTPQPAADPAELAWGDAFIADTLRNARLAVGVVVWIAVASGLVGILTGIDEAHDTDWALGIGSQLLPLGYVAVLIVYTVPGSQQYYLRRLWPQVLEAPPRTEPVAQS